MTAQGILETLASGVYFLVGYVAARYYRHKGDDPWRQM